MPAMPPSRTGRLRCLRAPTKLAVIAARIRTASRPSRKTRIAASVTTVAWLTVTSPLACWAASRAVTDLAGRRLGQVVECGQVAPHRAVERRVVEARGAGSGIEAGGDRAFLEVLADGVVVALRARSAGGASRSTSSASGHGRKRVLGPRPACAPAPRSAGRPSRSAASRCAGGRPGRRRVLAPPGGTGARCHPADACPGAAALAAHGPRAARSLRRAAPAASPRVAAAPPPAMRPSPGRPARASRATASSAPIMRRARPRSAPSASQGLARDR